MENLKISNNNFLFSDCSQIYDFWKNGFSANSELTDLISESILLYTFYFLGEKVLPNEKGKKADNNTALIIKKYVDDNFSDISFSLNRISNELSYNTKYISSVFKKNFGIGIVEYLNTIRIQHACTLIKQGFTSVCDIGTYCGYSDPQYFSKVFKQKMGITPSEYVKSNKI
ncbi:MAG: helix-turn-helix transcriptional regulator [Clostridia bacterium]|nr:helix-turn-helix transcriptional regulator [Clostridia bacterium]